VAKYRPTLDFHFMLASAMRFTFGLLTFVAVAVASPTFQLVKRASASDVATIGYATLNGG
jgi:hypothetical protein